MVEQEKDVFLINISKYRYLPYQNPDRARANKV